MLKRLVHGTRHIDKQIITSFSHCKNLSVTIEKFFIEEPSNHLDAFKRLESSYRYKVSPSIPCVGSNVYAIGKPLIGIPDHLLKDAEVQALQLLLGGQRQVKVYSRLMFHNIMVHSTQWNNKGLLKQSNATVAYRTSENVEYGIKGILVTNKDDTKTQIIVLLCKLDHTQLQQLGIVVPHIFVCPTPSESSEIVAISIESMLSPCMFMAFTDVPNSVFVAAFANLLEKD